VLVEVPLRSSLSDLDAVRRELDGEAGVRVPEETRAEIVVVEVRDPAGLAALDRLRASMELVAPKVALAARIAPGLGAALHQAAFRSAHRIDIDLDDPAPLARLLGLATRTGTPLLVTAASIDLAMDAASRQGPLVLALDPTIDEGPLVAHR